MVDAKALIEFAEADTQVDRNRKRLAEIQGLLKETAELRAARAALQACEQRIREVQTRQKSIEMDVDSARSRIRDLEARMMDGQVSPRDLSSVEREIGHLRERQRTLEDGTLTVMEEAEQGRKAREAQAQALARLEAKWRESQAALLAERQHIEAALPGLERERAERAQKIDDATRKLYERVKVQKGGRAIARVDGNICSACRMTVPTTLIQRARARKELIYCNSCGRILYAV